MVKMIKVSQIQIDLFWMVIVLSSTVLFVTSCSQSAVPSANVSTPVVASLEAAIKPTVDSLQTLEATAIPTATSQPTLGPTATVWPPTFALWSLQDIRDLDSFVVTINEKNTVNGDLTELTHTIGYIKGPYSAYYLNKYSGGEDQTYVVNGITYSLTGAGDWYISTRTNNDFFFKADIPAGNTGKLVEAQFKGQEDFQGIAAYHFVLDPTNSTEGNTNFQLEGDFYLAQEGNYILFSHWKETSSQENWTQVYEVTESLSAINQLIEIKLPTDMTEMAAAVELPAEIGLPLPGNSAFDQLIRYKHGINVDLYYFGNYKISSDEFLDFYRQLQSVDGWEVTHIGHVNLHERDCEFSKECVIINKGTTQVVLYYDGSFIRAEFDWPHLYSPL